MKDVLRLWQWRFSTCSHSQVSGGTDKHTVITICDSREAQALHLCHTQCNTLCNSHEECLTSQELANNTHRTAVDKVNSKNKPQHSRKIL